MIFPPDDEIRQYSTYYIRALGIFKEEFKNNQGRPPTEFELQDFCKMGIIPFGFLPKQNGSSNGSAQSNGSDQKQVQNDPGKTKDQNLQGQGKTVYPKGGRESEVLRLLNEFQQNLERKSPYKIKVVKDIPRSEWNSVKKSFEKEGWKYDWNEKSFVTSEEMKA